MRKATDDTDCGVETRQRVSRQHLAKQINDLGFADDIKVALLESLKARAQEQLTKTASVNAELGLIISVPKTEYMCFNAVPGQSYHVYGETINQVDNFKFLGSMMASSGNDLKRRRALTWAASWKLQWLWRSTTIPIGTKVKLFKTTSVTLLLYG